MSFSFGVAGSGETSTPPVSSTGRRPVSRPSSGFSFGAAPSDDASTPLVSSKRPTTGVSFGAAPKKKPSSVPFLDEGVDGVAQFLSRPAAEYRFQLTAKNDKLGIWIEDRKSKKQWQTSNLAMEDFVKEDSTIPQASFQDYVSCFLNCLQAPATSDDFACDLIPSAADSDDGWELRLTLKIRVFVAMWTPTYTFQLKSVPLEPVDLLAAKIRDQEDQIGQLQGQVQSLTALVKAPPRVAGPMYWRSVLTQAFGQNQTLLWKTEGLADGNKGEIHLQANGSIKLMVAAVYVVQVSVANTNSSNATSIELLVNAKPVATCVDSNANSHSHVSAIYHVFQAKLKDELSVVYRGNSNAHPTGSYLTIHQLR